MFRYITAIIFLAAFFTPIAQAANPPPLQFDAGSNVSFSSFLRSGEGPVSFFFTSNTDSAILGISLSAVGVLSDIDAVSISISNTSAVDASFVTTPFTQGSLSGFGEAFGENFYMGAGETAFVTFTEMSQISDDVTLGMFFETAAVPLPAAAPFLLSVIGLCGFWHRQRQKTAT
ncbi:MAG: hypothetical protein AAGF71_08330 [Pseudomonadota bacterium]